MAVVFNTWSMQTLMKDIGIAEIAMLPASCSPV